MSEVLAIIDMPSPLSLNGMFSNVPRRGRVKTPKYKQWTQLVQGMAMQDDWPVLGAGPFFLTYEVGTQHSITDRKIGSNSDIDNLIKCMADALVDNGVIPDDSMRYVSGFEAYWVDGKVGATVKIREAKI